MTDILPVGFRSYSTHEQYAIKVCFFSDEILMIREDSSKNNKNFTFFEYSSYGETVTDLFVKLKI